MTILATSREPLHVAGEQTYPLSALSLPDPMANAQTVGRSEAVQLFVERAQKQQPDFALTVARAPVVAELCIRLDGIPLALELAAARLPSLSIEQINARLDDRFRLLTGGPRTALPRQQTLRAALDWSYDLLAEQKRAVLRRMAVFAGGFTLEAASSVASDEAIDGRIGDPAAARAHYERALSFYERAGAERQALAMLNNLADMTWVLGDLDAALAASLEAVAHLRQSPHARKSSVGICLSNLAGLRVERGELGEALAAA